MSSSTTEKSLGRQVRKYWREYNETTGIQGLRYLTEKRSRIEKVFWAITLILSLAGCVYMIHEIVAKYRDSPVVVSFAKEDTPIYQIPYPAITICPEVKYSSKLFNFSDTYFKLWQNDSIPLSENEFLYYDYLSLLCDSNDDWYRGNATLGEDFSETVEKLMPTLKMQLYYNDTLQDVSKYFTRILIDQGICYTFNILDRSEMFADHVYHYSNFHQVNSTSNNFTIEKGYSPTDGVDTYPRRALASGAHNALNIYLQYNSNDTDYVCNGFLQGFRALLHNSWELPHLSSHYFRVPIDKIVTVTVEPEMIVTSKAVKKFKSKDRKCYLSHERTLNYFKIYTQSNCLFECLTEFTLSKCGCVDYHMSRNETTPICGTANINCTADAATDLRVRTLEDKISGKSYCDCKPECTSLKYKLTRSQSHFYWREYFKVQKRYGIEEDLEKTNDELHWSVLTVYFKSEQFITLERNELYGTSDFISNFGGLLGLFTGFSLISLVESLYFLTLRIYCNRRLYGNWFGQ